MTTILPRKRKLSASNDGEAIMSGSPPRQRMRLEIPDLASDGRYFDESEQNSMALEENEPLDPLPELPTEIWLEILTPVASWPFEEQIQIPYVCRAWYNLSKHAVLSWWNINDALIMTEAKGLPRHDVTPVKLKFSFVRQIRKDRWRCFYELKTKDGQRREVYAELNSSFQFEPSHGYYLTRAKLLDLEYDYSPLSYQFDIGINMRELEKVVASGCSTPNALYALAHLAKKFISKPYKPDTKSPRTPKVPSVITTQPKAIEGVELHQYQIDAINWMVNLERDDGKVLTIKPLLPVPKSDLFLCVHDLQLITKDQIEHNLLPYTFNGGILADETGLGKSLEVIGLILSNPPTELPKNEPYFATKATLIICPGQLVKQWSSEISEYCGDKLRVIELPTIKQVRKWTYQDIIDADVVIMSYDMLFSEHFIAHPELVEFGVDREETMQDRYERLQNLLKVRQNIEPNKIKGVVLEHFHWHRIVADEYDEMNLLHFQDYQRTYAWCVSGTPEIDYNAMQFIGLIRLSKDPDLPEGISPGIVKEYEEIIFTEGQIYKKRLKKQLILEKLFWRNTKESVRGEFEMVESIQRVIRLDFTPLETTIYEYLKNHPDGSFGEPEKKLMNFCCQLSDETNEANISLQHLKDEYISILKNDIASKEQYLDELRNKYLRAVKDLNDKFMSWRHRECKNIIRNYPEACESEKHLYIDFFEETLAKLQSQKASRFKSPLIDKYGTKLGNLVLYLRQLFREDDEARVIIVSKDGTYLRLIGSILKASRIKYTVAGGNVLVKANAIRKFKEDNVRVIMMDLNTGTSGLSLIKASHVILVDPISDDGDEALAYERRAIGYVKRQGQEQDVMVVKFIVSNTIEEKNYSNYADCALLARIRASST